MWEWTRVARRVDKWWIGRDGYEDGMIVRGGGCVRGGYEADDVASGSRMRPGERDWSGGFGNKEI